MTSNTTPRFTRKLLSLSLHSALICSAFNQIAHADYQQLDTVAVTAATQTESSLDQLPVSVEVITAAQIEQQAAVTLRDILQYSGVFFNPSAGNVSSDNGQFSIRGVSSKGSLLLMNGRRIGTEFTKAYDANRIPASAIERIEIIKGPMAALYGSDALGGVINIITKKPVDGFESSLSLSHGANQHGNGEKTQFETSVRGQQKATGYSAWFSALKTGDYSETETAQIRVPIGNQQGVHRKPSESNLRINPNNNMACGQGDNCAAAFSQPIGDLINDSYTLPVYYRDPSEIINIGGEINHQLNADLALNFSLAYMHEQRNTQGIANVYASNYISGQNGALNFANIPYAQALTNQRVDLGIGAKWQVRDDLQLQWQSSLSHYDKQDQITSLLWQEMGYASQDDSPSLSGDGTVQAVQHSLNATWQANAEHRILMGAEYFADRRDAAFFDEDGSMSTIEQDSSGVFAQHEWQITQQANLIYGLRYDDTSAAGEATTAHIGSSYQFMPALTLRARYAQGFRAPDSQENFINRYNPQGKRFVGAQVVDSSIGKQAFDLEAEQSENIEVGIRGFGSNWQYDLALFYTEIENNILREQSANYISFRNASKVTLKGLDFSAMQHLNKKLSWDLAFNLLDSYDKDSQRKLDYTPDIQIGLGLKYQVTPDFSTQLRARYVGQQNYSETVQGQTVVTQADAYTPVDLKFNYALAEVDLFAGIDNLLKTDIDPALGNDIGRYFYAGIRWYIH